MKSTVLPCEDNILLKASLWSVPDDAARAVVVVAPALGVPHGFYARYASYLNTRGFDVLSFDYRGIAGSGAGIDVDDIELAHWGTRDLQAALQGAHAQADGRPVLLVGHSIGGQIIGLAGASEALAGLVLVAASAPHPSRYPWRDRLGIELMWRVLVPLFGRGRQFPARRLGFASLDLPGSVMRRWRQWGLSRDYLFDARHGLDVQRYARLDQPLLAYSFTDDRYASRAAVEALLEQYSAARIEHRHVAPASGKSLGHFGYFRESQRDTLWRDTADWLERQLPA